MSGKSRWPILYLDKPTRSELIVFFGGVAFMGILVIAAVLSPKPLPKPVSMFHSGQIVEVRLTGEKAMILEPRGFLRDGEYRCRVEGSHQKRRDGLVSADSEIVRYSTVVFHSRELRKIRRKRKQ